MKFRSFSVLSGIAVLTLLATACGGEGDDSASSEQYTCSLATTGWNS